MRSVRFSERAAWERPIARTTLNSSGHIPSLNIAIPAFTSWLDETMGPVSQ